MKKFLREYQIYLIERESPRIVSYNKKPFGWYGNNGFILVLNDIPSQEHIILSFC